MSHEYYINVNFIFCLLEYRLYLIIIELPIHDNYTIISPTGNTHSHFITLLFVSIKKIYADV